MVITKLINGLRKPRVNVVSLFGLIAPGPQGSGLTSSKNVLNVDTLNKIMGSAFKGNVSAVCLRVNSPGGSPVQSQLIRDIIAHESSRRPDVKVISFAEDYACSGGYWLLTSGSEMYASPSSIVGSIGVISNSFGFAQFIKNYGIERRVMTAGSNKALMDPFLDRSPQDEALVQDILNNIHKHFIDRVKESRNGKIKESDFDLLFSGAFWTGEKALELGLIDGIHSYLSWINQNYSHDKVTIKHFGIKQSKFPFLKAGLDSTNFLEENYKFSI